MVQVSRATLRRIKRSDRLARWVITLGGVAVIASVVAILLLIVSVTLPLFRPATASLLGRTTLPLPLRSDTVLSLGIDMAADGESATASILTSDGTFTLVEPSEGRVVATQRIAPPEGSRAKRVAAVGRQGSRYTLLWDDGATSLVEVTASSHSGAGMQVHGEHPSPPAPLPLAGEGSSAANSQGRRAVQYAVRTLGAMPADGKERPRTALMRRTSNGGLVCVALIDGDRVVVRREARGEEDLFGNARTETTRTVLASQLSGSITAMTASRDGSVIYAGTGNGRLIRWTLDDQDGSAREEIVPAFHDKRAVTSLAMAVGDVSLVVGDSEGGLSAWFPVRGDSSPARGDSPPAKLRLIHRLQSQQGAVREILPGERNRLTVSLGADGAAHLDYLTSERHLLRVATDSPLRMLGFAPQGNALVGLDDQQNLLAWTIDCPHPEVSWAALFGNVSYEGYDKPSYAWQTTGGEEFEPKLSLVPLLFGTVKGTFYALLLAVPLALAGAAYTSHFTTPGLKRAIKPTVEIMAALPSVVIGFLAALWLAPLLERWILGLLVSMVTIPLVFLAFMALWQRLRTFDWARRLENGYEFLLVLPAIALGITLAMLLAGPLESLCFEGNFRQWMFDRLRMPYDQRNSVVIAFGLGFAVIPIIFSIAEDSLSNVPHSLTAASLALGASRWQTLWRVVLPSGSPGIFAGVMIGFGRAVGETMIVLMATGNTPILDWSPWNGMRTLSANIAVEIPEAPVDGTLYRVLFLCAVLLFLLTFILNTAAELVRQRLRKRFGRY